jgi:DNA-binding NarL/FixJ family response regulator
VPSVDDRSAARAPRHGTAGRLKALMFMKRSIPLIVVASASTAFAEEVAARLRREGNVVYVTHSAEGCLRVATSVMPDVVLLDPSLPPRLERLLRAHPSSASAQILHVTRDSVPAITPSVLHAA